MGCCWLGRGLKICGGGFLGSAGCDYMGDLGIVSYYEDHLPSSRRPSHSTSM